MSDERIESDPNAGHLSAKAESEVVESLNPYAASSAADLDGEQPHDPIRQRLYREGLALFAFLLAIALIALLFALFG